ncbi:MAG TPA: DinB family protein [Thermoanaerobaculia bacterium]|nr:DinB family protein [Thermoanaerobaculia bacterium]
MSEIDRFIEVWEREAKKTAALLAGLPSDQYDFRPDAGGRSLGELAWHLAEGDAYITHGIEQGGYSPNSRPPGIERPRKIEELAPNYERVHRDAVERVRKLKDEDLDRSIVFFSGQPAGIRDLLWDFVLLHSIHHRGQLTVLCRLAGGRTPHVFGPAREDMPLPPPKVAATA